MAQFCETKKVLHFLERDQKFYSVLGQIVSESGVILSNEHRAWCLRLQKIKTTDHQNKYLFFFARDSLSLKHELLYTHLPSVTPIYYLRMSVYD